MKALSMLHNKKSIAVFVFALWSILMISLGSLISDSRLGMSMAEANISDNSTALITLDKQNLLGKNLGEFSPYEPNSGDLIARGVDHFYSEDGNFGLGVWESKPGQMTYTDLEYDELMYVLEGRLIMTPVNGEAQIFDKGEAFVLPKGWSGTLAVPEMGVRKIWVAYMGGKK